MKNNLLINSLALVHSTNDRPRFVDDQMIVDTSFSRAGGFLQQTPTIQGRQTLHFCLQSAVTDHAYGKFEGRKWIVVAPLEEALLANGQPESLLASDVAFFPKNGSMILPKSQLIEFTDALPSNEFICPTPQGFQVSRSLNANNLSQALEWFDNLASQGFDVKIVQKQLKDPAQQWTGAQITEFAVTAALTRLGKPSLHHIKGTEPGSPMSFDGWASTSEIEELKHQIEENYPTADMETIQVGRHDGTNGDRLLSAVVGMNHDKIRDIYDDPKTPLRIKNAAKQWAQSDLLRRQRYSAILHELHDGPMLVSNDFGQEQPGLIASLLGQNPQTSFQHNTLGAISIDELNNMVQSLTPSQRNHIDERWNERLTEETSMSTTISQAKGWLASFSQPPPAPPPQLQVTPPNIEKWRAQRSQNERQSSDLGRIQKPKLS